MDRNDAIKTLSSERPLFSEFLAFDLDERQGLIEKHKTELKYISIEVCVQRFLSYN